MSFENAGQATGLQYQPNVPKEGWECVRIENLARSEICQWCDLRRIKHAFIMRHLSWPVEIRAGSKCAANISNPYVAQTVYEPDDEQLDESIRSETELYPQQALAEQPIIDDTVGSSRRWSFSQHLIMAVVITVVVILVLLGHRYY
jgi:hypothetical protein